jgi:mRNA-degrading endonuclease RelE of RelBE toxin-antitoxin system
MYQVKVTKTAEKQLDKIPNNYYLLITAKLKKLEFDP